MNNAAPAVFIIEGGQALELVQQHVAAGQALFKRIKAMQEELGNVRHYYADRDTGRPLAFAFDGAPPPGFNKPDKHGLSFPKKGTAWAARLKAERGYPIAETIISEAFNVSLVINYCKEGMEGWRHLGAPYSACGWLYITSAGPYGMWVPDIPAEVAAVEAEGYIVQEPAKSFKLEFDGCRRIEREEWEILVLNHKLAKKKEAPTPPHRARVGTPRKEKP